MTQPEQFRAALRRRVDSRIGTSGSMTFPAVPALVELFTDKCTRVFAELGRVFDDGERAHLQTILDRQLTRAFELSSRSQVIVTYQSPVGAPLSYDVDINCQTIEDNYHEWIVTREPPLFGAEPDAKVCALAGAAPDPAAFPVLDIGAGTGRNALALARRGHPVDAVEMTEKFAASIREAAQQDSLNLRVIQREVFAADDDLRRDYQLILLSEVVPEFRTAEQLRDLFVLAGSCLAAGGLLVFNAFLADPSYQPDQAARQFAQQVGSTFFTRAELLSAATGLPFRLESDESCHDYEKAHLPDGAWPPTSWYTGWSTGHDVFALESGDCPVQLRWLIYRKSD